MKIFISKIKELLMKKSINEKIKGWLINTSLLFLCLCLLLMFASLCNKYSETQYKVEAAKFEKEAAQSKANTESLKMQTAQIYFEAENVRLKAFIKAFSNGTYPNGEIK